MCSIISMEQSYLPHARVHRGYILADRHSFIVDELEWAADSDSDRPNPSSAFGKFAVQWQMHTYAQILIGQPASRSHNATLSLLDKRLHVQILNPDQCPGHFMVEEIHLAPPQFASDGLRKLMYIASGNASTGNACSRIAMSFGPPPDLAAGLSLPLGVRPMASWSTRGALVY